MNERVRWTLLGRTIDNHGDIAILWRLALQLAREYAFDVELRVDDIELLEQLAGAGTVSGSGVRIAHIDACNTTSDEPPEVVITGLDVDLPARWRAATRSLSTVWIGYQYLSAEPWIDDCHGLSSVKSDGAIEHFWFPGFTGRSGGLLKERSLIAQREAFQADPANAADRLVSLGVHAPRGAQIASLFCYPKAPLDELHAAIARTRHRLHWIVPVGAVRGEAEAALQPHRLAAQSAGRVTAHRIPFQTQDNYDRLLWSCKLNFVRGEDSWIRALWANRPLLWQAYPQPGGTHRIKVDAFIDRFASGPTPITDAQLAWASLMRWWNGREPAAAGALSDPAPIDHSAPVGHATPIAAPTDALIHCVDTWLSGPSAVHSLPSDESSNGLANMFGDAGQNMESDLASRLVDFVLRLRQTGATAAR